VAETLLVARREFRGFFATPAAWLFLGAYLAATLFVFFWAEPFFARNLADVRPLFQWLPVLMIFLVAALTMRAWSEERRAGTLESLLTSPVRPASLVLGKFLAVLGLVAVALALTLPLPFTVSRLGDLDWGPVIGGYVAALLLAAAYAAVGLWSSARTDNPIVALILTVLVCGLLWLVGAPTVTNLFGNGVGRVLAELGTGRRFESITRGVLDLRDLYYYASIVGVFLGLNRLQLDRLRWAGNPSTAGHQRVVLLAWLAAANFAAANLWLDQVPSARVDLTRGHQYTLSPTTRAELAHLDEPLLLRGYFSARTHPLLAPLVPQLEDVLREYGVAAGGRARVELVDPEGDHAAEEEAASRFGVRPVPFQTADRYQAAVVNSYFDVVVSYGDQHVSLGFRDLVEVKDRGSGAVDVALKDPEYLLTSAIRKVVTGYRGGGNPFDALAGPVTFHGYVSVSERLPQALRPVRADLDAVLSDLSKQAGGKLRVSFEDPDAAGGTLGKELSRRYGFTPRIASLVDPQPFWFDMLLEGKGDAVQVPLPEKLDRDSLRQAIQAALQRLTPGVLRTIGLVAPTDPRAPGGSYSFLEQTLSQGARVEPVQLDGGRVPEDVDLLMVMAPRALGDLQRFAIDQFLMRGGSVILCTSPFDVQLDGALVASRVSSGLEDWLAGMGIHLGASLVLDPRSATLPVPVQRENGGLAIQEIQLLPYPHFADLRTGGLDRTNPVTASLGQLTVPWASPIEVDAEKTKGRATRLLQSSPGSWVSDSLDVVPDFAAHPDTGFPAPAARGARTLAVALQGPFPSAFAGKSPPAPPKGKAEAGAPASVLAHSPANAHLLVVASNAFASDATVQLMSEGLRSLYTKPVDFLQNAVDWSLEDPALLALRGRSRFAATLVPLTQAERRGWEYANYALALVGLGVVFAWRRAVGKADRRRHAFVLEEVEA
jgi:ABC-2 type transport system permease protein